MVFAYKAFIILIKKELGLAFSHQDAVELSLLTLFSDIHQIEVVPLILVS